MSVAAILAETAHRMPDNIALIFGEQQISYGELWEQTRRTPARFATAGIGAGDPVALLIPTSPTFRGRTTRFSRSAASSCRCTRC